MTQRRRWRGNAGARAFTSGISSVDANRLVRHSGSGGVTSAAGQTG